MKTFEHDGRLLKVPEEAPNTADEDRQLSECQRRAYGAECMIASCAQCVFCEANLPAFLAWEKAQEKQEGGE